MEQEAKKIVQERRVRQINLRIKYMPEHIKGAIKEKISQTDLEDTDEDGEATEEGKVYRVKKFLEQVERIAAHNKEFAWKEK